MDLFFKHRIKVYSVFNDDGDYLYVIDATTGKYVKKYRFSWAGNSSPVAVNGIVYVGGGNTRPLSDPVFTFYAFDALTATEKWVQKFEIPIETSPTVAAGTVFVCGSRMGSKSSTVYALDALTGAIKWESSPLRNSRDYTAACVVTKKGVVYHPSDSGDQQ